MRAKRSLIMLGMLLALVDICAQKRFNSLLWEISGNGLSKSCYLYGTMHVSRRVAFHLSDSFFIALNSAGIVALESNPELWLEAYNNPEMSSSLRKRGPEVSGPGGLYNDWFSISTPKSNTYRGLLSRDPGIIDGLLYRQSTYMKNFEEDTYLDLFIFQSGRKLGKKISSLEGLKESEELVDKAFLPDEEEEDEKEMKKVKKKLKDLDQNLYEMMEDSYRRGDLDMLDSVTSMMNPGKNYRKYMLDERNIIMARTMDSLMKHNVVFSAIGAAHLPGEMGVIELLRKKGYKVRPIVFSGERDSKMKEKIEKIRYPVTSRLSYSDDSTFSVQVPGKLTSLGGRWMKSYIFSDMANGSYYAIYRLYHMNAWTESTKEMVLARIDSMLFENIPGKIFKKIPFTTPEGYVGFDISNKTKTGDQQRYKIIVTPLEVYLMKCSGTGDYILKEKAVNNFFSSMQVRSSGKEWKTFRSTTSGFEVKMPPDPYRVTKFEPQNARARTEEKVVSTDPGSGKVYMAMSTSCYDFNYLEHDTFELRILADHFLEENKFEHKQIRVDPVEGYASFSGKKDEHFLIGRVYLKGTSYYIFAVHQKDSLAPSSFFQGIGFFPRKSESKVTDVKDTVLYFNVHTGLERSGSPYDSFRYSWAYKSKKKKKDNTHKEESKEITYVDRYTREAVEIRWVRLHKYYTEDTLQNVWKDFSDKEDKKVKELQQVKKRSWKEKDTRCYEYYLKDKACGMSIYRRFYLYHGCLWIISTMADSAGNFTPGIAGFLQSFSHWDTLIGKSPEADKAGMLLNDLSSADSLTRDHAEHSVNTVFTSFSDQHYAALSNFLKSANVYKLEIGTRADLVSALGKMGKSDPIPLLKELFRKAGDTASLQLGALEGLLRLGTKAGNLAFIEMMQTETPLISGNSSWLISGLFRQINKNQDVAKHLFPALLDYTRYPEYEERIYELLAELIEKKKIAPEVVAMRKESILRNAKDELKRQLFKEEEKKGDFVDSYRRYSWMSDYNFNLTESEFIQYGNRLIYDYACLLVPYYQEPAVKNFFDRIRRSRNAALKIAVYAHLLDNKISLPDTLWKELGNTPGNRLVLIAWLNKVKRPDLIPAFIQKDSLVMQAFAYYYQNAGADDSLQWISSEPVQNKLGKRTLNMYKFKEKDDEKWGYFGLLEGEADSTGLPEVKLLTINLYGIEYQNDDEENIKELRKQAVFYKRERLDDRYYGGNIFSDYMEMDYED